MTLYYRFETLNFDAEKKGCVIRAPIRSVIIQSARVQVLTACKVVCTGSIVYCHRDNIHASSLLERFLHLDEMHIRTGDNSCA